MIPATAAANTSGRCAVKPKTTVTTAKLAINVTTGVSATHTDIGRDGAFTMGRPLYTTISRKTTLADTCQMTP
jgi:hypothetical protein